MFAFQLARDFKELHVEKLMERLSPREFNMWWAAYLAMGWGCDAEGLANVAAQVWNVELAKGDSGNQLQAADFMPMRERVEHSQEMDGKEIERQLNRIGDDGSN